MRALDQLLQQSDRVSPVTPATRLAVSKDLLPEAPRDAPVFALYKPAGMVTTLSEDPAERGTEALRPWLESRPQEQRGLHLRNRGSRDPGEEAR